METLSERLAATQRDPEQPPHISPSSITSFMKCSRQWQETYVFGRRGGSNSSLTIGSAVHLALSRLFKGEQVGDYWNETVAEQGEIDWKKDTPSLAKHISETMIYHYWEQVGKFLDPIDSEIEAVHYVTDVDLPILGIPDLVTDTSIIDFKTTAYFNAKQVRVNKDWKIQQAIYQLWVDKPSEIHVLTRDKTNPVVVPTDTKHRLYLGFLDKANTQQMVQDQWRLMNHFWEMYGEEPWPGNQLHEYADKYCGLGERCCKL